MEKIDLLEKRIITIEKRNDKVEQNKLWETSFTRKGILIILTYLSLGLYFNYVLQANPWLNAIVPTIGFWFSTLSLPLFRKIWEKYIHKERK